MMEEWIDDATARKLSRIANSLENLAGPPRMSGLSPIGELASTHLEAVREVVSALGSATEELKRIADAQERCAEAQEALAASLDHVTSRGSISIAQVS
jgi:hypothetical protein